VITATSAVHNLSIKCVYHTSMIIKTQDLTSKALYRDSALHYIYPFTRTIIHRWRRKPWKAPICLPGAIRSSESCSRTLQHSLRGALDHTPASTVGPVTWSGPVIGTRSSQTKIKTSLDLVQNITWFEPGRQKKYVLVTSFWRRPGNDVMIIPIWAVIRPCPGRRGCHRRTSL